MVQMGDRDACDRVIHNLNGAACFGRKLSIRYDSSLLFVCYNVAFIAIVLQILTLSDSNFLSSKTVFH